MFFVRISQQFRSAGFRFTLLYTLAVMVSVAGIGWLTRATIIQALEAQARDQLENESEALVDEFNQGGRPDLDAALAGRFSNPLIHNRYLVIEANGGVGPGDASLARLAGSTPATGAGSLKRDFASTTRRLTDGSVIIVANDLREVHSVEAVVQQAFLVALAISAGLGLIVGLLLSSLLLRRVDAITVTAEAVIGGDLSRRIATTRSGDEFDRLSTAINRMLDRIGGLVENLRQVSSDVAHDLRTPLSRLRQGLEAADLRAATVEAYRGAVSRAISETDAILDIFSALLRIAQIESGARRGAFTRVDLSALLRRVADAYVASAEEGGRSLSLRIVDAVSIEGDADLLVQLFANLIENGLQHTPPGTRITLSLDTQADAVMARLDDDGPGIPDHEWGKVFQRFYRLDRSRTTAGHGLGLSLVGAITELHNGQILLGDNSPGLSVRLTFPLRSSPLV